MSRLIFILWSTKLIIYWPSYWLIDLNLKNWLHAYLSFYLLYWFLCSLFNIFDKLINKLVKHGNTALSGNLSFPIQVNPLNLELLNKSNNIPVIVPSYPIKIGGKSQGSWVFIKHPNKQTDKHATVDMAQFEFESHHRFLVPAVLTHSMYRLDPILCLPRFNFDGAVRLFTVPGL